MATTTLSNAVVYPQDDGTGVPDGSEKFNSAGYQGLLAQSTGSEYKVGLAIQNVDGTNDVCDVSAGHAYIVDSGAQVQSGSQDLYDTTFPAGSDIVYVVVLPSTETNLPLDTGAVNDVYLAVDPTSTDGAYLSYGSGISAPTDPHIKLGTADVTGSGSASQENAGRAVEAAALYHEDGSAYQASIDGMIVPFAAGLSAKDAIDPASATNPVQDAIDLVEAAGGGVVLLPVGEIECPSTLYMKSQVSLIGHGMEATVLSFPTTDTDAIHFDAAQNGGSAVTRMKMGDFAMMGARVAGAGNTTGYAIRHVDGWTADIDITNIMFTWWTDSIYKVDRGTAPFQITVNQFVVYECDFGNATATSSHFTKGGMIQYDAYVGPAQTFNIVSAYPTNLESGTTSKAIHAFGGDLRFRFVNLGGHIGQIATTCDDAVLHIEAVNWEPDNSPPAAPTYLFEFMGHRHMKRVDDLQIATHTANHLFHIGTDNWMVTQPGKVEIGDISYVNGTKTGDDVHISSDLGSPCFFKGVSAEVDNQSGSALSHPIVCLSDGVWKTSTGTGANTGDKGLTTL